MTKKSGKTYYFSIRFLVFVVAMCLVATLNSGCDWFDDDDDNASTGGAGTTATTTTKTTESTPQPQPTPAPEPQPQPTPTTTSDKNSYPTLAGTGIVWKPVSEGNHKLVILTPTSYGNPGATVLDTNNQAIEAGSYVGHTNGNRATYRFGRRGGDFPAPCRVKIGSSIFTVGQPDSRYN